MCHLRVRHMLLRDIVHVRIWARTCDHQHRGAALVSAIALDAVPDKENEVDTKQEAHTGQNSTLQCNKSYEI